MSPLPSFVILARRSLASIALLASAAAAFAADKPEFHDGRAVVRVTVQTTRDVRTLLALSRDVLNHRIDVGPVDAIFDKDGLAALAKSGLPHQVIVGDLGPVLRADFDARASRGDGGVAGGSFFADFRTLDETYAQLDAWIAARPDLVSAFTIGTSLEGRPIRGIRITKSAAGSPGVLFNATQHAREWGAQTTSMYIADRLIAGYGTDARVTALLDRAWVDIVPVCNPDGYVYTWTTNRLWRKNRRNNGDGTFGVDLNRNWAFQWGGGGASTNPADETYRGPSAFSEPESAALRDYFISRTTLAGHIDFHAYSQLVLSPWGYTTVPPANNAAFLALGNEMKDAIKRTTGFDYTVGPIASTLYIASGSSVDHAYGQHGVPSYTIEVRDKGTYGFVMPASEILPNASENYAAALDLADVTVDGAAIRLPSGAPVSVQFDAPGSLSAEVRAIRGSLVASGVKLYTRTGSSGSFTPSTMTEGASGIFSAPLAAAPCGSNIEWYIAAQTTVGTARLPRVPGSVFVTAAVNTSATFTDTFETALGWTVGATGDNATAGLWTRVDPVGTTAQPENDSADAGLLCFVTGQGVVGGAAGAADVDGGTTTLVSPVLNASDPNAFVSYRRWYSNNLGGAPNEDSMPVQISGDGGATWITLETVTENAGAWVEKSFRVSDFIAPSANARLRFVARDLGTGSLVEAGVDFVRVLTAGCPANPADINGDGTIDASDLAIMLGNWGSPGVGDLNGDGTVGGPDLTILLGSWG
ncbi:MAG: M14 family zinc carboxypeptidase [Planctomycetota bacterium]